MLFCYNSLYISESYTAKHIRQKAYNAQPKQQYALLYKTELLLPANMLLHILDIQCIFMRNPIFFIKKSAASKQYPYKHWYIPHSAMIKPLKSINDSQKTKWLYNSIFCKTVLLLLLWFYEYNFSISLSISIKKCFYMLLPLISSYKSSTISGCSASFPTLKNIIQFL